MECGALICKPRNPLCQSCPLSDNCFAYKFEKILELPFKSPSKQSPHYDIGIGIIWKDGKVLIGKRKSDQMLGGLWEFPGGKKKENENIEQTVLREINEETNLIVELGHKEPVIKHAYSHFKITLHPFHCVYVSGELKNKSTSKIQWVNPEQLDKYPFPTANKKLVQRLIKEYVKSLSN